MKELTPLFNFSSLIFWVCYISVNAIIITASLYWEKYWLLGISAAISIGVFIYFRLYSQKIISDYFDSKKGLKIGSSYK